MPGKIFSLHSSAVGSLLTVIDYYNLGSCGLPLVIIWAQSFTKEVT